MAVSVIDLADDKTSLEFDESEITRIKAEIYREYGIVEILSKTPLCDTLGFGGEKFLFYREWNPCLISMSAKGADMLRLLASNLKRQASDKDST